jgi:hemerythrin superfamily protein
MSTTATRTRTQSTARTQVLAGLKEDHKHVRKAYKEFEKLDREESPQECEALVQQVLDELTLHAALEEEFLYPAVRAQIDEQDFIDLLDEAEVEHETMHDAIGQLRTMGAEDDKFAARFTVLCEYVLHHVKEEEGEMFPKIEKLKLDWEAMADGIEARRAEAEDAAATATAIDDGAAGGRSMERHADKAAP